MTGNAAQSIEDAIRQYDGDNNVGKLIDRLRAIARSADADTLAAAVTPWLDRAEVVIPIYERIVEQRPRDARALVTLANVYWLSGRGPDVVGELAERAREADPANRAAWHLWALAQSDIRLRMERWREVAERFPADQLARAALADNAVSVASAEHDPLALDLAIATYEGLWQDSPNEAQRAALEETLAKLRTWRV